MNEPIQKPGNSAQSQPQVYPTHQGAALESSPSHLEEAVSPNPAASRLSHALDTLREINQRLCRNIDTFLAARESEVSPEDFRSAQQIVKDLTGNGVKSGNTSLTFRNHENIEGSLYISQGDESVRFRWIGSQGQDLYIRRADQEELYVNLSKADRVSVYRATELPEKKHLTQESEDLLSRRTAYQEKEAAKKHESDLAEYNSAGSKLGRFFGSLFGHNNTPPMKETVAPVVNQDISPEALGLSPEDHTSLTSKIHRAAYALETACKVFEERRSAGA